MGTCPWCLHPPWPAPHDPDWHWGGAQLGGSASRWVHLLPIRSRWSRFLPSGDGRLLLRHSRSHLTEARGSGYSRLSPCPAAPTDTCSCQQVLCSGSRQHVHGLEWRHSRWRVTRVEETMATYLTVGGVHKADVRPGAW